MSNQQLEPCYHCSQLWLWMSWDKTLPYLQLLPKVCTSFTFSLQFLILFITVIHGYLNSSLPYALTPANPSSLVTFSPKVSASFQLEIASPAQGEFMLSFYLNVTATGAIIRGSANFTVIPGI